MSRVSSDFFFAFGLDWIRSLMHIRRVSETVCASLSNRRSKGQVLSSVAHTHTHRIFLFWLVGPDVRSLLSIFLKKEHLPTVGACIREEFGWAVEFTIFKGVFSSPYRAMLLQVLSYLLPCFHPKSTCVSQTAHG
jgi:hypothetical protein